MYVFILERERGQEREKHGFVSTHVYAFISHFLHVPTWMEPTTLAYLADALTKGAMPSGLLLHF